MEGRNTEGEGASTAGVVPNGHYFGRFLLDFLAPRRCLGCIVAPNPTEESGGDRSNEGEGRGAVRGHVGGGTGH